MTYVPGTSMLPNAGPQSGQDTQCPSFFRLELHTLYQTRSVPTPMYRPDHAKMLFASMGFQNISIIVLRTYLRTNIPLATMLLVNIVES